MNPPLRLLKGFRILGGTKSIETRLKEETTHRDKKTQGTKHPEPGAATFMKLSLDQIRNRWVLEQLSEETSWQRAEDQAKKIPLSWTHETQRQEQRRLLQEFSASQWLQIGSLK